MNFKNVFFFGQYGLKDGFRPCSVGEPWRTFDGWTMPTPKTIDGVPVCAPGDLIERLGSSAVKERIAAALRRGRQPITNGGFAPGGKPVPQLPARAWGDAQDKGAAHVRHAPNGTRNWAKLPGAKRWHAMRDGEDESLCGRHIVATRVGPCPSWHLACFACLNVINRKKAESLKP